MSIKVENVTKLYGKQKALDDISFEIQTGEIVGFLGPNGAGKSTMMKIITGFIPQNSGEILVNGLETLEHSLSVRRQIGYLPEHNPLYLNMYVKEQLEFTAGIYKLGKQTASSIKNIIARTGLQREQHKKIGALSKGYRQRVGLAQALIHDPKVLILDEPTTGLDPNQIVEIRNLISEVGQSKTVMLSTHIMQEVEAICNKIIIINNGKIVADDSAENLHRTAEAQRQIVLVEFDKKADKGLIENLEGVEKVVELDNGNLLIESMDDIRVAIFNFAVENKLAVLSMQKQEKSLEEIFQDLTQ